MIRLDRIVPDPTQPRTEFDQEALARLAESLQEPGPAPADPGAVGRRGRPVRRRRRRAPLPGRQHGRPGDDRLRGRRGKSDARGPAGGPARRECLREDLKPIEQARAYQALLVSPRLSQRQLAERLQIGHASIARALALLELPEPIQEAVDAGQIAPNTAYELTKVDDPGAGGAGPGRRRGPAQARRDQEADAVTQKGQRCFQSEAQEGDVAVCRTTAARVTIELQKGDGLEAILAAAEEAVEQLRTELATSREEAA